MSHWFNHSLTLSSAFVGTLCCVWVGYVKRYQYLFRISEVPIGSVSEVGMVWTGIQNPIPGKFEKYIAKLKHFHAKKIRFSWKNGKFCRYFDYFVCSDVKVGNFQKILHLFCLNQDSRPGISREKYCFPVPVFCPNGRKKPVPVPASMPNQRQRVWQMAGVCKIHIRAQSVRRAW